MSAFFEIQVEGRLDATLAGPLEKEVEEAVHGGRYHIRLNLNRVVFLSSAGIRVLLKSHQMLRKLNGSFGVLDPSPAVKAVLELSGLMNLVAGAQPVSAPAAAPAAQPQAVEKTFESLECTIYTLSQNATLKCRLVGNSSRLESLPFTETEASHIKLPRGTLAVGLGAFGNAFGECRARFGEFLAAGGAAACLPSDGAKIPDFMVTRAAMVPELQVLYALVGEGEFAQCVRFETEEGANHAPLSQIVAAALAMTDTPAMAGPPVIGWVMLAESAGLIGAALKRSPAAGAGPTTGACPITDSPFDYPAIRDWLAFTPEREFARTLTLVVGFATAGEHQALKPFVRPVGRTPYPAAHAHAAVFSIKALPKGPLPLDSTVGALFEEERLLGLLHLIGDHREISGTGESLFTRGTLWLAPVGSVEEG
ncbi:MAG: STAS domain-containing protein [Verrucomicrobia bacterium]|nr:STAS domain-containing protein [Verrucomicrobiota bacterium]MBU1734215.1 STAS domain-containing protein [Verrucomicrobiota bacterium]MBU1855753.1 STAS domain-containing protein [Verrucomicrobiota bacterium]